MNRRALGLAAAMLAAALPGTGCRRRCWYEWRDEPYVRPVFLAGEETALRRLGSVCADDREIGARALAVMAREARAKGEEAAARRLARVLMDHCRTETDPQCRSMILAVCLREAGEGDLEVHAFLESQLLSGRHPAAAAYALAALRPPGAFGAIRSTLLRATDCELRYELLGALWLLGDRRAVPVLEAEIARIDSCWPERVHHMPRAEYRKALSGRLRTLRAACRTGPGGG